MRTPNALVVADFTYVKPVTGVFAYVAFVIDAYAGAIIGGEQPASERPGSWSPRSAKPPHYGPVKDIALTVRYTTPTPDHNVLHYISVKLCPYRGYGHR